MSEVKRLSGFFSLVAVTAVVVLVYTTPSYADCLGIARGIKTACLADTGDGKVAALFSQNQKCTRDRVVRISSAWKGFNEAVDTTDAEKIKAAAANVQHQTFGTSTMFTSCWRTMRANCNNISGGIDETINSISLGAC